MGARHPNPRLAKIHRSYSVEEIARLFKLHKNTVRAWLRQGLEAIDGQRPTVVRGEAADSRTCDRPIMRRNVVSQHTHRRRLPSPSSVVRKPP
jgi:transposase-like protein